ncbi:MAG: MOSC domain-containing protein [Planctomycetota bacterium]|nr:MOSC domain-containing protein [Planctomycetota bacterium]
MTVEGKVPAKTLAAVDWPGLVRRHSERGTIDLIVVRKPKEKRELVDSIVVTPKEGLPGDRWNLLESRRTHNQITLMNSLVAKALCGDDDKLSQFGDNLLVDFDLSEDNLPPGTQIQAGQAILEITEEPHTGCSKFARRFGKAALKVVSLKDYDPLKLRGIHARVLKAGKVTLGDTIGKLDASEAADSE